MFIQGLILDNPSLATILLPNRISVSVFLVTSSWLVLGMTDKLILGKHKSGLAPPWLVCTWSADVKIMIICLRQFSCLNQWLVTNGRTPGHVPGTHDSPGYRRGHRVPPSLELTRDIASMSFSEATCRIHVFMKHGSGVMGYYKLNLLQGPPQPAGMVTLSLMCQD